VGAAADDERCGRRLLGSDPQALRDLRQGWIDAPDGTTFWKRSIVRTESEDFITWSKPQLVMAADEFDGHRPAQYGGTRKGVQLHGAPVFVHEGVYIALLQPAFFDTHGHQPIELAISRDGIDWQRPWRSTFLLPVDGGTSFDSGRIWSSSTPVILDDEIRFYYGAANMVPLMKGVKSAPEELSGVGMASVPRDRFAGIVPVPKSDQITLLKKPLENVGQVTFKPLDLAGTREITINADASKGSVAIELLNEDGYRVRGFTKDDAVPLKGDSLRHKVAWNGRELSKLPPGRYTLRVHLDNATLHAVTFGG
jgi:hypothetical protein